MAPPTSPLIFDSVFLSKLEQLHLLSKKLFRSERRAERPSKQLGSSLEFADYRNYSAGDDLRNVDWNIYGRLDRLVVKLFEQEQDLNIYFLIDGSDSMRWLPPAGSSISKFDTARRIAASLAYIGLANLDRVNVHWFGATLGADLGLARGKSQFNKVLEFLRQPPDLPGTTNLNTSFQGFANRMKRRGLVFILSDLFDPAGFEEGLALLRHAQFDVHVIHVLDPSELRPKVSGDLRLVDSESGTSFDLTANDTLLNRYHEEIDAFIAQAIAFCRKREIAYAQASTSVAFEDLVLQVLREGRMV